jgi:hypothetical protein
MANGAGGHECLLSAQLFLQAMQLARGTVKFHLVLMGKGQSGGVVSAVFQAFKALNYQGDCRPVPGVSDYSTHFIFFSSFFSRSKILNAFFSRLSRLCSGDSSPALIGPLPEFRP